MRGESRRILLFGGTGQVGSELRVTLAGAGEIVAPDHETVDLRDAGALRTAIRRNRPVVVINAAAYTAVDEAESEPQRAHDVNAAAVAVMAKEAHALHAMLVHYSTDYVYDGAKPTPYIETDATNPLSIYGRTKLAGDRAAATCPRHLVFRSSWIVSVHGTNFVKTMLRLASERDTLRVVTDQRGAPTSAALVARVTATALDTMRAAPAGDARWGVYHLTARGETNWNELARHITARGRDLGFALRATPQTIAAIATAENRARARRPANSRLDTTKLRTTFGVELPDWHDDVDEVIRALASSGVRSRVS